RKLGSRANDDVDPEPELVGDEALALPCQRVGLQLAGEDDVPALDVRPDVLEAGVGEQLAERRHRDAVARAEVDAAEEDDLAHCYLTASSSTRFPHGSAV